MNMGEITQVIEETILEMLKEGDNRLVGLMMEHERNMGGNPGDETTFINETIERLSEKLGILSEDEEAVDSAILLEQEKMLSLIKWSGK